MTVTSISRWQVAPGKMDEVVGYGRRGKEVALKHGAEEFRMAQVHAGAFAGQVMAVIRCADWASYGKMMQGLGADPVYQDLLISITASGTAEITGRSIVVGIDL